MTRKTDNQKNLTSERSGLEMLIAFHPKIIQPSLAQKKEFLKFAICQTYI